MTPLITANDVPLTTDEAIVWASTGLIPVSALDRHLHAWDKDRYEVWQSLDDEAQMLWRRAATMAIIGMVEVWPYRQRWGGTEWKEPVLTLKGRQYDYAEAEVLLNQMEVAMHIVRAAIALHHLKGAP